MWKTINIISILFLCTNTLQFQQIRENEGVNVIPVEKILSISDNGVQYHRNSLDWPWSGIFYKAKDNSNKVNKENNSKEEVTTDTKKNEGSKITRKNYGLEDNNVTDKKENKEIKNDEITTKNERQISSSNIKDDNPNEITENTTTKSKGDETPLDQTPSNVSIPDKEPSSKPLGENPDSTNESVEGLSSEVTEPNTEDNITTSKPVKPLSENPSDVPSVTDSVNKPNSTENQNSSSEISPSKPFTTKPDNNQGTPNKTTTKAPPYMDESTFEGGLNGWDPEGMWAKYDLKEIPENQRLVPLFEKSSDGNVFISVITPKSSFPNKISKKFPSVKNAILQLIFYLEFEKSITLTGRISNDGLSPTLFRYTEEKLSPLNKKWTQISMELPGEITEAGEFNIEFVVGSLDESMTLWALDSIVILEAPPTLAPTTIEQTTPKPPLNPNPAASPDSNKTTAAPPVGDNGSTDDVSGDNDETNPNAHPLSEVKAVATALWEAFYVFLALFIACLIALIGLIAKQKCSAEEPPPASVSTYNPRTSSYKLDKVYDNPSYESNQV